ncbi:MAG: hypothetical protein HRU28_07065 [Rhizobiales bacterium]|nr:hypothetical protein [Hyphomicrobiales bacterium]
MSQNLRLVEYFLSDYYRCKKELLAHIVSPTFAFIDSSEDVGDYDRFIEYTRMFPTKKKLVIKAIESPDDIYFVASYYTESLDYFNDRYDGKVGVLIKEGLIDKIRIHKTETIS